MIKQNQGREYHLYFQPTSTEPNRPINTDVTFTDLVLEREINISKPKKTALSHKFGRHAICLID